MQGYKYETKGDNNKESDLLLVDESQVVGKVVTIYHILAIHQYGLVNGFIKINRRREYSEVQKRN